MNGSFQRSQEGNIAVEFALTLPVVALLLTAMIDVGIPLLRMFDLQAAADAAGSYSLVRPDDDTGIVAAAENATTLTAADFAVTLDRFCGCGDAGSVSCSATCSESGLRAGRYVIIELSSSYSPLFSLVDFGLPSTLQASRTVRLP